MAQNNKPILTSLITRSASLLNQLGLAWWVEILTNSPRCTYYFGPFASAREARAAQAGYVEDLEQEGAEGIKVMVKRCQPPTLTVSEDLEPISAGTLSHQLQ